MTELGSTATMYGNSQRTLENSDDAQKMDDAIIDLIIDMGREQDLLKEKPLISGTFNLNDDPRKWDSSQLKIWISQFLNNCDIKNPGEVIDKLEKSSINGATLASMNEEEFTKLFGDLSGDIMHSSFKGWIDNFKKNQIVPNAHYPLLGMMDTTNNMTDGYEQQQHDRDVPTTFTQLEDMDQKLDQTLSYLGSGANNLARMFDRHDRKDIPPVLASPLDHSPGYGSGYDSSVSSGGYLSSPNYYWPSQPGDFVTQTHLNFNNTPWFKRSPGSIEDGGSESEESVTFEPEMNANQLYHHGYPVKREANYGNHCHEEMVVPVIPQKRKRGRPKKIRIEKPKRVQPILYKFILLQLDTPESRSYIEWVNKTEGVFRFHSARKDDFAKMWGKYKRNREPMTYQNMARALRNYTKGKRKVMERVKRKLHYKFCAGYVPT